MRFGGFASRLSGAAVLVFAGVPVETTPAAPHIAHYETAQRVALRRADPSLPASRPTVGTTLEFHAFGRQFLLLLEPNERLVAPLRSSHRLPTGDRLPLRGRIAGHPSSWARFSIIGGRPSGVVWDGHELFLVDSAANLGDFLGETLPAHTIVAFRASDLRLTIDEVRHPDGAGKTMSGDQLLAETVRLAASSTLPQPGRAIPLGLILDAPFAGQGLENALFPTNIADGIHSSQLDLHLDVEHIEAFDYANDPFVSSDPGVLLQQVSSIKASVPALAQLGLAHLLTARDLDGEVRGVALLKSVCGPAAGAGLTEVRGSTIDGLIMAHEIAHNLGAPHDGEAGSACASTPTTFLMASILNGSSEFSQCSLDQMAATLTGAACLTEVVEGDVSLVLEPPPQEFLYHQPFSLRYFANNLGSETSFDASLQAVGDNGLEFINFTVRFRDCGNQPAANERNCELGTMYGGESDEVDVTLRPVAVGRQTLRATISAASDRNPSNNEILLDVDVQAATDLIPRSDPLHANARPGDRVALTARVRNEGEFDTHALLRIQTSQLHSVSSGSNCTAVGAHWLECELGTVLAGSLVEQPFTFTVDAEALAPHQSATADVYLTVDAAMPDFHPGNDSHSPSVTIWGAFIDLRSEISSIPSTLEVGEDGEVLVSVTNDGPDRAPDARLELRFPANSTTVKSVSTSRGSCEFFSGMAVCDWVDFAPGERVDVTVGFAPTSAGPRAVSAWTSHATAFDSNEDNNRASSEYTVVARSEPPPPPAPGAPSSGGGGATLLLPLVMLGEILRRRNRPSGRLRTYDAGQHSGTLTASPPREVSL